MNLFCNKQIWGNFLRENVNTISSSALVILKITFEIQGQSSDNNNNYNMKSLPPSYCHILVQFYDVYWMNPASQCVLQGSNINIIVDRIFSHPAPSTEFYLEFCLHNESLIDICNDQECGGRSIQTYYSVITVHLKFQLTK